MIFGRDDRNSNGRRSNEGYALRMNGSDLFGPFDGRVISGALGSQRNVEAANLNIPSDDMLAAIGLGWAWILQRHWLPLEPPTNVSPGTAIVVQSRNPLR